MRFRQNGVNYKYLPQFHKKEDDLKIKYPVYYSYRYGEIKQDGIWKKCRFYLNNTTLEISPVGIIKNGISNLGKVNEQMCFDKIKLSWFNRTLINIYDRFYSVKIWLLTLYDRMNSIKSNLLYILLAFIGSSIYFLINHYFDNFLQKFINDSNFAQSFIVFLSISSIINIFHPFTLRKELSITDVDELAAKKLEKMKEKLKHEEWVENKKI